MKKSLYYLDHLKAVSTYSMSGNPCPEAPKTLNLYPNPANHYLTLDLRDWEEGIYFYQLFNENGVIVLSGETSNIIKNIEVSSLENGHYFLHFYGDSIPIIRHIYVQH